MKTAFPTFVICCLAALSSQDKTIYIVRHGETSMNTDPVKRVRGRSVDLSLNEIGLAHSMGAGDFLKNENLGKIYYSKCKRAKETAEMVARQHAAPVELVEEPLVYDISWGKYEGMTFQDAFGDPEGGDFMFRPEQLYCPEGESFYAVQDRLRQFLINFWYSDEQVCTIVTHGAVTNCLALMIMQSGFKNFWTMYIDAACSSKITMSGIGQYKIKYWNMCHYLKDGEDRYLPMLLKEAKDKE